MLFIIIIIIIIFFFQGKEGVAGKLCQENGPHAKLLQN